MRIKRDGVIEQLFGDRRGASLTAIAAARRRLSAQRGRNAPGIPARIACIKRKST